MKSYKEVVEERYDGTEKEVHIYDNIYSLVNPIGFNADKKIRSAFFKAYNLIRKSGTDLSTATVLDIGCGKGSTTRFFAELTGNASTIYGVDLSNNRIEEAKRMNPAINYQLGDLVQPIPFQVKFDIITTLDVFMHLGDRNEILTGLENIKNQLKEQGYFIWYDAYSKDHFSAAKNADHCGFSPKQMDELARSAGFEKITQINLFKTILWKYHSLYLIKKFPVWFVNLVTFFLPGPPGNMLIIYKRK